MAAPVEPVEDSADDPVPEHPEGTETDEELDKAEEDEAATGITPAPEERAYRWARLTEPSVTPRLRRRFARRVVDETMLDELITDTQIRCILAPDFPREHEPLFTWAWRPAQATRRKKMRAWIRLREREAPLEDADKHRYALGPDGDHVSDLDAARYELVATIAKEDSNVAAVLWNMHVAHAMPAEDFHEPADRSPAARQRHSRALRKIRDAAAVAGLLMALVMAPRLYSQNELLPVRMVENGPADRWMLVPREKTAEEIAQTMKEEGLRACAKEDWRECISRLREAEDAD